MWVFLIRVPLPLLQTPNTKLPTASYICGLFLHPRPCLGAFPLFLLADSYSPFETQFK